MGDEETLKMIETIRSFLVFEVPDSDIIRALSHCNGNPVSACKCLLGDLALAAKPLSVVRTNTSTGTRISARVKQEEQYQNTEGGDQPFIGLKVKTEVKGEPLDGFENDSLQSKPFKEVSPLSGSSDSLKKSINEDGCFKTHVESESPKVKEETIEGLEKEGFSDPSKESRYGTRASSLSEGECFKTQVKHEFPEDPEDNGSKEVEGLGTVSGTQMSMELPMEIGNSSSASEVKLQDGGEEADLKTKESVIVISDSPSKMPPKPSMSNQRFCSSSNDPFRSSSKPSNVKNESVEDQGVVNSVPTDAGDFPNEPNWFLVGSTVVTALSTTKGRKLADNEIVYFNFPRALYSRGKGQFIVRFSTKRFGEIGRMPIEWAKTVTPLVLSSKVKARGRCVAAPPSLHLMQEILLYVSFYTHISVLSEIEKSSWSMDNCAPVANVNSTIYPLLSLFKLLDTKPYQKAEFTPEELDSRKRKLNLEEDDAASVMPLVKRGKGCHAEENKEEQTISESTLNKLVGAAEVYDLQEMEPPHTLVCTLKAYQKEALYWMSELEKGIDVEKAAKTLHPCWAAYRICDLRASSIFVNIFSGEATTKFPTATQMARGGILADAMGLGKTVMTIALLHARPGRGCPDDLDANSAYHAGNMNIRTDSHASAPFRVKGGTLIVCPMALLGQWKDELETHSEPGSISIFVHYGGDKTRDHEMMSRYDVVLTTYGVLTAAYKSDEEFSIFHRVNWYRVVLDEAHTIKCAKTLAARAAFKLSSYCRWCLTGTPLQNDLEDLYSLLCFLNVEPWCNWAWWNKLIQKPYECGDPRGLRLIKAILRSLMLRRTKDTRDKEGRRILVLPPTDIQVIECESSQAEHDFYNALFERSKAQFDHFVAEGKVLHNYASILELLLRLRQCCNHPFLVINRSDSQQFAYLNKFAQRFLHSGSDMGLLSQAESQQKARWNEVAREFLESCSDASSSNDTIPSRAYIEEFLERIQKGEISECPICMEYADNPVFTPCAHMMCNECLLNGWGTSETGYCPICRRQLQKRDLMLCPSENHVHIDVNKNWKDSSKVSRLMECLKQIDMFGTGEKSIVFSQWTSFLDLLEIPLRKQGIGFLRFDGSLHQKQRERVLKEFNEGNQKKVLLMSLKAGGVGLNLTAASNVFLMDPWWNPAVEEQAIMRIHRIGQKRKVYVRRFIVKDTVEERLQQVQDRKQKMIAGALTDEEVRSARIDELKMLFR